jgi:hypothetical protein
MHGWNVELYVRRNLSIVIILCQISCVGQPEHVQHYIIFATIASDAAHAGSPRQRNDITATAVRESATQW